MEEADNNSRLDNRLLEELALLGIRRVAVPNTLHILYLPSDVSRDEAGR